jgi:hypothetical protein
MFGAFALSPVDPNDRQLLPITVTWGAAEFVEIQVSARVM